MGIAKTVLLPAGSKYGLAANCGGNNTVLALARAHPKDYVFFANELPDIPETKQVIEKYLKLGAIGIGEQKFHVDCDSKYMQGIAEIARDHGVPVLMHFQHETYNLGYERFHKMLEKYPKVIHWSRADLLGEYRQKSYTVCDVSKRPGERRAGLTPGCCRIIPTCTATCRRVRDLNALLRDEDHARGFLKGTRPKLLYGSDCSDSEGAGQSARAPSN